VEGKPKGIGEDWLALWLGLGIFVLGLGTFVGLDVLGWGVKTSVWTDVGKALAPVSSGYGALPGIVSLLLTYVFLLVMMGIGAIALGANVRKFVAGFTVAFWLAYGCWLAGHWAHIAATPDALGKFGITWSLKLTGEAGFIVALAAGLVVGNFFPRFAAFLGEALRPELYIKTAIVVLGAGLGAKAAESMGLASAILFRGLCASVEVYLIDWAIVYLLARTVFKFNREWAVPLASGISICGVSAAIATGAAIRARPVVPIMVSSLVVIFAVVELIVLPFLAQGMLWTEPMVAGDWMGLAVKTDGAAVASGAIVDSLVRAKALAMEGVAYKEGWMVMSATTSKIFIDFFIGVWAFVLALIWCTKIEKQNQGKVKAVEIWQRFPKFVIGYFVTFAIMLAVALSAPAALKMAKAATGSMDVFRVMFFVLTFFSIGAISNFKKLWEEGFGKLAAVYLLALFGFIVWVGLGISWIFFHGIKPPLATG
jgi:uncharacterized membrane protein YadS